MMPALRTLLRSAPSPWFLPRLLHAYCRHAHGDAQSGQISLASDETCRQDVDSSLMLSASGNERFELQACRHDDAMARSISHGNTSQACQQHVQVLMSKASLDEGPVPLMHTAQRLEKLLNTVSRTLKSRVSSRQKSLKSDSQVTVQHMCNAESNDDSFAPASESNDESFEALSSPMPCEAEHMMARSKRHKHPQSATALDLLHRKVSLLELEQVSLGDATILGKSRAFKSTSVEHLAAVLKVLRNLLGSSEKACEALAGNPGLLSQPLEHLEQKLKVMADFEITEAGVRKLGVRKLYTRRKVLSMKTESLHKRLSFLKEVGLNVEALNKLLCKYPTTLWLSPEGSSLPNLDFFKSLGMTREKILRSVHWKPSLLMLSVENVKEKCTFLQHQLGFSVKEIIRAIYNGVIVLSMELLQARIKFLKDEGFSDRDVHWLISRQPSIIKLRSEAVKRKLDFLICEQKYDMADIVKWPACLTCSLQGRLIPRFKVLQDNGLCRVFSLSTVLGCSDVNFLKLTERKGQ